MAATAVHLRVFASGAQAAAAPGGRRSTRRARARGRRRCFRDHLRPLLPRTARLLRAHAGQSPGGGGRPAAQLRLGVPGAAWRQRRHRPAPVAVHDRPQPLPVGPARAPRRGRGRRDRGRCRVGRWHGRPRRTARRPARAGGRAAAPARRPARRAGPLRARRRVPRADRGRPRRAQGEGQGARLPSPRGPVARPRSTRDTVRGDPRAAGHPHRAGCRGAASCAPMSSAARAARSSSATCAASAPRSR